MPFFGMILLLAGLVLFIFTNIHAPEKAFVGGPWVYKPGFYYLFITISLCFIFYGLYEIVAELWRSRRKRGIPVDHPPKTCSGCQEVLSSLARFCPQCGRAVPRPDITTCPRCGYGGNQRAHFCELCGHPLTTPPLVTDGASAPEAIEPPPQGRNFLSSAAIVAGLVLAIFLGIGLYAWHHVPRLTSWLQKPNEVKQSANITTGPLEASKSQPKPEAPLSQAPLEPFQVGSKWAIDWQSKYQYRGILHIKEQLAANQYFSRITVTFTNSRKIRKTVSMDALVTIRGQEVVINCRNPSVSWWDTDDFYLEWDKNTMTGYNVDIKGRRGQAVFTLVEGT